MLAKGFTYLSRGMVSDKRNRAAYVDNGICIFVWLFFILILTWGRVLLKDISAARIEALYNTLGETGAGKRNVKLVHIILYGSPPVCPEMGLVSQNWAELVEVPKIEKREMAVWSEGQVSSFLAAYSETKNHPEHPDLTLYRLAFQTGMRRVNSSGCSGRM